MTQDTRKDPRAKIVSLNVRYKSATVDEFIENHSHDVSRGGIFIKTSTPFPQGTLLKFEIRLSGDQAVIAGVGRVVWKREAGQSASERPSGMGVKFIKIDEASRAVIDRLVTTREGAGSAFTSELKDSELAAAQKGPGPSVKRTIMGMGMAAAPPPHISDAPRPAAGQRDASLISTTTGGFFPPTGGAADMPPPQERTMMKQAAELLEEALREAGGSMDEVGSNPLFAGPVGTPAAPPGATTAPIDAQPIVAVAAPPPARSDWESPKAVAPETPTGALPRLPPLDENDEDSSLLNVAVAPPAAGMPPPAPSRPAAEPRPVSAVARVASVPPPESKSRLGLMLLAVAAAAIGGGVFFLIESQNDGDTTPVTTASAVSPTPSAPVSAAPVDTTAVDASTAAIQDDDASVPEIKADASVDASRTVRALVPDAAAAVPVVTPPRVPRVPKAPPSATAPSDSTATPPTTPTPSDTTGGGGTGATDTPPASSAAPKKKYPEDENPY